MRRIYWGVAFLMLSMVGLHAQTLTTTVGAGNRLQASALPAPEAGQAGLVTLRGNTRPEANAKNDRGRVSDDLTLSHMMLQLRRSPAQEQALQQFINDIHDHASPLFHHWITAAEFGQRYGVAPAEVARVTDWLESQGFTVNLVYPNQMVIDFTGSAGQIRQAFHTEIHHLLVKGEAHIANMNDPQIPPELASTVAGVVSLNDFRLEAKPRWRPNYTVGGGEDLVVPADLWTIYNFSPAFAQGFSGQGQTIVVVENTDLYSTQDWSNYRSAFGLTSAYPLGTLTQVHPGSCTDPGIGASDNEAALDVEVASAGAPSATIELASCADSETTPGFFIAFQNLVNGGSPPAIVSSSQGAPEPVIGAAFNASINSSFQQAVAEGVSVFVSSGDTGGASTDQLAGDTLFAEYGITVSGATSTPYNVSVGGTDFADNYEGTNSTYWSSTNNAGNYGSALSYIPEIPWNDSCASVLLGDYHGFLPTYGPSGMCYEAEYEYIYGGNYGELLNIAAGAGGPSGCATGAPDPYTVGVVSGTCAGYPKPSWQAGFIGNPSDGVRDIPDVSLFAANGIWGHAYVICFSDTSNGGKACSGAPDTWNLVGGTSASAPVWAAIQSLANQASGSRWGNPDSEYYSRAATEYGAGGRTSCKSALGNTVASNCIFYDVTQIPLIHGGSGTGGDSDIPCNGMNCYLPSGTYISGYIPMGVLSTAGQPLTSVLVTSLGSGYTSNPTCTLSGGGGSGATCSAIKTGVVSSLNLTSGGSGYTSGAICTLTGGGGSGATCGVDLYTSGAVADVFLTNYGSGYTSNPTCAISPVSGGGGTGATCTATKAAGISASLVSPGSGYTSLPDCVLSGGGGTGGACSDLALNSSAAYQPAFGAATGWDFATGIGTVNVSNLVASFTSSLVPAVSFSVPSLGFGSQPTGTTSTAQTETVTNTGTGNLTISTVTISGTNASDFAKSADTCTGATVTPNNTCAVSVTFDPSATGSRSASLNFTDNASNSPQTVSLTGNGSSPASGWQLEPGLLSLVSVGSDGTVWGINGAGQIYMFNPETQIWQQAPGLLTQVVVGSSGFVWGLNAAGQIYRYDPALQSWDHIPGALSQIAVGSDGDVWGINSSAQVFHFNSATQTWTQIPGALAQIAVGYDGAVWGINAAQQIFRFNPGTQSWQQIPGALKRVAVGADGDVWGINSAGQIFHFNSLTQGWENTPGSLAQIAVGSGSNVWGIDASGAIWRFNAQAQTWDQIPGQLAQIAVGANGAVWGLNSADQIFQFVQPTQPTQTFHSIPGVFAQIAAGIDGEVWAINAAQQIYRFDPDLQNWQQSPGALTEIRVGFGGNVWGLNAAGQICRFNPSTQGWELIPGLLAQLAVGADGSVWGINSAGQIFRFNASTQGWKQIPGLLAQLAVGADGTVWGINGADQIFRFNPSTQGWEQIPGLLVQIAVGSANNVWGINAAGQIYRYDPELQAWVSVPGQLTSLAVAFDGTVWGLNSANQIFRYNAQEQNWNAIPGLLSQISVGADAVVWGLNANGQAYEYW